MVRTDERTQKVGMARELTPPPFLSNELHQKDDAVRKNDIERVEKEIVRLLTFAERDKRESIAYLHKIKRLKEQIQTFVDTSQVPADEMIRRCHSDGELALSERYGISVTPPSSYNPVVKSNLLNSATYSSNPNDNASPNISPTTSPFISPLNDALTKHHSATPLDILAEKEEELARVRLRAKEEACRCGLLRDEEAELRQALSKRVDKHREVNKDVALHVDRTEKEIQRISLLAERDKRNSMATRDQILSQKRILQAIMHSHLTVEGDTNSNPELLKLINSCDEVTSAPSTPPLSSSSLSSATLSVSPLSLTPSSPPSQLSMLVSSSSGVARVCQSPLRQELDRLMRVHIRKEEELSRVSAIAGMEAHYVCVLKAKSQEMHAMIVLELHNKNEQLELKIKQFKNKQDGLKKVAQRTRLERTKSCVLQEGISKYVQVLSEVRTNARPVKKSEYIPDKGYFTEFPDLPDLTPLSPDLAPTPADASTEGVGRDGGKVVAVDPDVEMANQLVIQFPVNFKQVYLSNSESVYCQRLRELGALDRVMNKMDAELDKLKRIKEAETVRRLLLTDKARELMRDLDYYQNQQLSNDNKVASSRIY